MGDPQNPDIPHAPPSPAAGIAAAVAGFILQQAVMGLAWNVVPPGASLALGGILGVWVPLAVWCRRTHVSVTAWLRLRRLTVRETALVFGFAAALLAPTYAVNALWQRTVLPDAGVLEFYAALIPRGPGTLLLGALGAIVFGPLAEEWVFRGLLQPALERCLPAPAAIPIVAVLFAAAHASAAFFPAILLLGLGLGTVAWWTRSTHASWLVHAVVNAVAYVDLWKTRTPETPELDRWSLHAPVLGASMLLLGITGWFLSRARHASPPGAARESAPAPWGQPNLPAESRPGNSQDGDA